MSSRTFNTSEIHSYRLDKHAYTHLRLMIRRAAESSQELSRKGKDAASLGNRKAECSLKSDSNVHDDSDSESEDT